MNISPSAVYFLSFGVGVVSFILVMWEVGWDGVKWGGMGGGHFVTKVGCGGGGLAKSGPLKGAN